MTKLNKHHLCKEIYIEDISRGIITLYPPTGYATDKYIGDIIFLSQTTIDVSAVVPD